LCYRYTNHTIVALTNFVFQIPSATALIGFNYFGKVYATAIRASFTVHLVSQ